MIKYMKMHFKIAIEYKVSFILLCISQMFNLFCSVVVILSLYNKFGMLKGFDINQCLLSLTIVDLGFYIAEFFFRGFDNFSKLIKKGNFDILLIRPENIYTQILGSDMEITKVSRLISGVGLLIYSVIRTKVYLSISRMLMLIACLIGAFIIFASIFVLGAALAFYTVEGIEVVNVFSYGSRTIGEYPMAIFSKKVILLFTFFIPIACINYYPLLFILGKPYKTLYLFSPLFTIVIAILSVLIFNFSLKHYKSTGS